MNLSEEIQGPVGVGEMAVAYRQEACYCAVVVKGEEENLFLHFVDWGNTDWISKSLVWPASWPGAYDSPLAIRQGSLLFSKFEFSIKPDLRDLSFS